MILETERLTFDELHLGDAEFIHSLVNDHHWHRYIGDTGVETLDDTRSFIEDRHIAMYEKDGHGLYRVDLKKTGEPIGICGLINREGLDDIDLGFAILPGFRRQGYMLEAASAMMRHAVSAHGLSRLVAITKPGNQASGKLLKKLGFRFEGMVSIKEDGEADRLYGVKLQH